MVRELDEELGISITLPDRRIARWVDGSLDLTAFAVSDWTGDPVNRAPEEHDRLGWFRPAQVGKLPLADHRYRELFLELLTG